MKGLSDDNTFSNVQKNLGLYNGFKANLLLAVPPFPIATGTAPGRGTGKAAAVKVA
jgi:hypothetical protein